MATPYKLRCNLTGHEQDVRALSSTIFPENGFVSGSRDNKSFIWNPNVNDNGFHNSVTMKSHSNFVSSICVVAPDDTYPKGLVMTGSNDKTILAFVPGEPEPVYKLTGHEGNVCALASGKFGLLLSGSWDSTARVWLNQKCMMVLEGHKMAVWAVGIISAQGIMLTGSADKTLKAWKAGKCIQTYTGHEDCVRGIAVASESEFLSCSNDASIRRWAVSSGDCLSVYFGHTNYVYTLCILPNGVDFITGGEDRTMRVWHDGKCQQTIYHPCESVWAVCTLPNGDIVSGASDGMIRVFTQCPDRVASDEVIATHEASLATAPVASQPLGDIKIEDLPGPDTLNNPGKRDGQTTMVNDNGKVDAYQWDASENRWLKIGNVVGSSGSTQRSSGKMLHEGVEYDYVFSVDITEGAPPIKLPYNITEDPWMAAQKFIYKNELPQVYLDQVANFIIENTKGATLSTGSTASVSDPFTGGDRYIPSRGESESMSSPGASDPFTGGNRYMPEGQQQTGASGNSHFPQASCLFFDTASPAHQIIGKLKEFNSQVEPGFQVEESSFDCLSSLMSEGGGQARGEAIKLLDNLIVWPQENVFPVLDILRMTTKDQKMCDLFCSRPDFIEQLTQLASPGNSPATRMLSLRTITNLFRHPSGVKLNMDNIDTVLQVAIGCKDLVTKNGQIAFATLILNYCVLLKSQDDLENKSKCLQAIGELLPLGIDAEASYRLLVAMGTLVVGDDGSKAVSQSIKLPDVLSRFQSSSIPKVVECSSLVSAALS